MELQPWQFDVLTAILNTFLTEYFSDDVGIHNIDAVAAAAMAPAAAVVAATAAPPLARARGSAAAVARAWRRV